MKDLEKKRKAKVSTHSRLKAAGKRGCIMQSIGGVSTHSRLKAAGRLNWLNAKLSWRFNTQPPEGGWARRWLMLSYVIVSTHSRLKAAGVASVTVVQFIAFQHTAA